MGAWLIDDVMAATPVCVCLHLPTSACVCLPASASACVCLPVAVCPGLALASALPACALPACSLPSMRAPASTPLCLSLPYTPCPGWLPTLFNALIHRPVPDSRKSRRVRTAICSISPSVPVPPASRPIVAVSPEYHSNYLETHQLQPDVPCTTASIRLHTSPPSTPSQPTPLLCPQPSVSISMAHTARRTLTLLPVLAPSA